MTVLVQIAMKKLVFKLRRQRGGRFKPVHVGHVNINDRATEGNEGQVRNKGRQETKC